MKTGMSFLLFQVVGDLREVDFVKKGDGMYFPLVFHKIFYKMLLT